VCEKCESLKRESKISFDSWLTQRAVNQQYGLTGKAARQEVERYQREYERASAKLRLHEATDHLEKGMKTSIRDINLVYR
jgi:predicted transcriptional regulator